MGRTIFFFLLVIGVGLAGLMLLRRTANMKPPKGTHHRPETPEEKREDEDKRGW